MMRTLSAFLCFTTIFGIGLTMNAPKIPACETIEFIRSNLEKIIVSSQLYPSAVRFAFHSCVGGCDGCINFDQPDNNGMMLIFDAIEDFYILNDLESSGISRADLWAMTGVVGASAAMDNHQGVSLEKPCFEFFWGRQDCSTSPSTSDVLQFPSPGMGSIEMFDYMKKTFNLDKEEVAAVLGAHTLGRAFRSNSGYNGFWTPGEDTAFNTTFYENMMTKNLQYHTVDATADYPQIPDPHWQWEAHLPSGGVSMMFNTDFELFFEIEVDEEGKSTCHVNPHCVDEGTCGEGGNCALADTYDHTKGYIDSPQKFFDDFNGAYTKMLQTKTSNLVQKGSTCSCTENQ